MRTERDNEPRGRYIMGVIVVMIILQVILIYSVLSDTIHQSEKGSLNKVAVEDRGSSDRCANQLLTQRNDIKIEIRKITLIAILMIGTGYLIIIKGGLGEEKSEKEDTTEL